LNGKKFANIDELCADIKRNYKGSEIGNIYDGKHIVIDADTGTIDVALKKLNGVLNKKDVKIIYLIAEENK
jgi:hypothetical protein